MLSFFSSRQVFEFDEAVPTGRLAALAAFTDIPEYGIELLLHGEIDQIAHVIADHRFMGRNDHHLQTIDLLEFKGSVSAVPVIPKASYTGGNNSGR
jgi:hypothetical protein